MVHRVISRLLEVERETGSGVRRDDLMQWYTESIEDSIPDEAALAYQHKLIDKVLGKMVKESHLLEVRGEGLADDMQQEEDQGEPSPLLLIHPSSAYNEE